jgi:hypothetical protein
VIEQVADLWDGMALASSRFFDGPGGDFKERAPRHRGGAAERLGDKRLADAAGIDMQVLSLQGEVGI